MKVNARRIVFTADAKFAVTKADAKDTGKIATLKGYAILWNVLSTDRGGFKVRLLPGSARFTTPVLALWHHDPSRPIGTTDNATLRLFPDEVGVRCEIDVPDTSVGRDAVELVAAKYVKGTSFAMVEAPDAEAVVENGKDVLNVRGFVCDEITVSPIPSFTQTTIAVAGDDEEGDDFSVRAASSNRLELLRLEMCRLQG